MKIKNSILLIFFVLSMAPSFGQNVYEWYQDGIVIFQIKTTSSYTIPSRDKVVDLKQVDFLQVLQEKYGIYEAKQLHPSDPDERLRKTYQIQFNQVDRVDALIRDIASIPVIEYAERKELHKHFLTPNDLGPNSATNTGMWHLYRINAQQAWDLSTGDANVKVAVTDDAIRTTHVDLVNKVVASHDATTGGSDANPCGNNDGNHGTHVSGTVGAETNNNVGVSSIGFNVSLMAVKIGNCTTGALTAGYEGINWAANNGADVINMSWGGGGSSNYGLNIVNAAFNAGSILVAAAGNDGTTQQFFPAAYNNVIAVASTTTNDAKSNFSQYGTWITISAPGSAIRSTWASSNTAYNRIQGTSMASPNVAGLVGLMKSYGPNASNQDIINCLLSSADDISAANPSFNGQLGSGRINAFAALQCVGQYNVSVDAGITEIISPSSTVCGSSFTPQVILRNFGANNLTSATINYEWNGTPLTFNWVGNLTTGQTTTVTLPVQSGALGTYTFNAFTSNPNNTTDENPTNNSSSVNFTLDPNGQTVDLTLITDCYGDEITWNITDENATIVASGGPYDVVAGGTTNNYEICLPIGCYTFTINDTYGDGMFGSQWQNCSVNGNYFMTDENNNVLFTMTATNANFGNSASHQFCVVAPNIFNDAGISQITSPLGLVCSSSINPEVELRNYGINPLTSVTINYQTTGGLQTFNWTGNLASNQTEIVVLPAINVTSGSVTLTAYTTNPNGSTDDNTANDQSQIELTSYTGSGLPLPFTETFENNPFSNGSWIIENPDGETTWEIATVAGTSPGNKAAKMDFYNYAQSARRDGMISPKINLSGYTDATMTFEHAYRRFLTEGSNQPAPTDSLIIYIATDCGQTWQRVFTTGENGTGSFATMGSTNQSFTPAQTSDWCMGTVGSDCFSVDLTAFVGQQIFVKFEGFNAGTLGNNLFVDNINITGTPSENAPIPSFTQNTQNICEGGTINFTDQSASNITSWSWNFPGGSPAVSTDPNPIVTYPSSGVYDVTLTVTNAFGTESMTSSNLVNVTPPPTVVINANETTICAGASVNLVASGASSYAWDNGLGSGPSKTVSPAATTTYQVTGSVGVGCTNTSTITINVIEQPSVSITASQTTICAGENVILNATGADTYTWNNGLPNGASQVVSPTATTNYVVTGNVGSCNNTSQITIVVNNEAQLEVTASSASICEGESVVLSVNGGSNYAWDAHPSLNSTTGNIVTANPTNTTTYTVSGNTTCGLGSASVTVTVTANPATPQITQNGNILSTSVPQGGTAQWYLNGIPIPGANTSNYTITESGVYTVIVSTSNGCSATSSAINAELDTASLNENSNGFGYTISPNPTKGSFSVDLYNLSEQITVDLYDMLGKKIAPTFNSTDNVNKMITFDLSAFSDGVYFIRMASQKATITEKIVRN